MWRKLCIGIALLFALTFLAFHTTLAQDAPSATTRAGLNIRSGPGTDHNIIGSVGANTLVVLEGRNTFSSWALIRTPGGDNGWVTASYLTLSNGTSMLNVPVVQTVLAQPVASTENTTTSPTCTGANCAAPSVEGSPRTTAALNVRSAPGQNSRRIGGLESGTPVALEGRNADSTWALVSAGNVRGWVAAGYLALGGASLADLPVMDETTFAGTTTTTTTSTDSAASPAALVSYVPDGRTIWQANSGPDVVSGTCQKAPLVMCSHLAAITRNADGTISWRGQELKTYTMRQSASNANVFSYRGRNGLDNAAMSMTLTFTSEGAWSMVMTQVFDDEPSCTHTFYYTATRNW